MEVLVILKLLSQSIKRSLQPADGGFLADQRLRCLHGLKAFLGKDVWFSPQIRCEKEVLGEGDGKWCICPVLMPQGGVVYSFGVGREISFDLALIRQFGAEVHGFDPTLMSIDWFRQHGSPPGFHFHPYGIADFDGVAKFSLPPAHSVSFTMLSHIKGKAFAQGDVCRLPSIFDRLGHEKVDMLKMDIEGTEYDVIPDIVACAGRIDQLLIEFHHRFLVGRSGILRTRQAMAALFEAGFRLFHVSSRGLEYSFIRTKG